MTTAEDLELSILKNSNCIRTIENATHIDLEITPGTARTLIKGYNRWRDRISIHLHAPARKGQANNELIRFLSMILNLKTDNIRLVKGQHSEFKTVKLDGIDKDKVVQALIEVFNE